MACWAGAGSSTLRCARCPHSACRALRAVQLALNAVDDDRQAHAGVFAGSTMAGRACSNLLNHCYR